VESLSTRYQNSKYQINRGWTIILKQKLWRRGVAAAIHREKEDYWVGEGSIYMAATRGEKVWPERLTFL